MKVGLNDKEVENSKRKYGENILEEKQRKTIFNFIVESFSDPIIKIMLIALIIKIIFMFKDFNWYETLGILIAIFLSTLISTVSEYGSEIKFKKLQDENKDILVKTYRNNLLKEIKSSELVVGDVIELESGDIVPADSIMVSGSLLINESMLTGESNLQEKKYNDKNETLIYKGTNIYEGFSKCRVVNVGKNTMYGKIMEEVQEIKVKSPLKKRLISLSKIINRVGYIGAFIVSFSYLFSTVFIQNSFNKELIMSYIMSKNMINDLIYTLTLCVTTIVVAVPEGLPMMITLVLSSNMKKMIKNNVLVRKMVGIETSGNINYLLTDKTGTITEGKLSVTEIIDGNLKIYRSVDEMKEPYRNTFLESLIYNSSSIVTDNKVIGGNETDKAIINFIKNYYKVKTKAHNFKPFNSENKYSEVKINNLTYIKGAYENILNRCNYYLDESGCETFLNKNKLLRYITSITKKGSRVLINVKVDDNKYVLINMIVIKDIIRKETYEGLNNIKKANINIIMITGDNKETAKSIAKDVNIITSNNDLTLSSDEFNKLSDEEVKEKLNNIKVISRALPTDKSRLVRIIQNCGNIVGMTGDGINDAPALKKADVCFAMGSGSSVAKEASDIVILDNNLLSISKAILYGRTILKSIRKFIVYQLSVNLCALSLSIVGPLIGINTPITIMQMLWLNMIMDTFAGLAFSFEPSLKEYLKEKPLNINENVINNRMYIEILTNGLYGGLLCILFLKAPIFKNIVVGNHKYFMTAYFALFIFLGIFNAFCARTERINILSDVLKNKLFLFLFIFISIVQIVIIYYGGSIFGTFGLKVKDLVFIIALSSTTVIINTIRKIIIKKDFNLQ